MTTDVARANGKEARSPRAETPNEVDAGLVVLAIDLLAHWWSRPTEDERAFWLEAVGTEQQLISAITGTESPETLLGGAEDVGAVVEEYERLFVGPGHVPCPPYESFWREDVSVDIRRTLMGPCTAALRDLYARLELQVAASTGELPDHVAVELEALAYGLSFEETLPVAHAIFFEHVRQWLPRLCRAVAHETTVPFYRELAGRTLVWLAFVQIHVASLAGDSTGTS